MKPINPHPEKQEEGGITVWKAKPCPMICYKTDFRGTTIQRCEFLDIRRDIVVCLFDDGC